MFDLTALNGNNGFQVEGLNEDDGLGNSVSTAGDINGDGRDDLVLGASGASPGGRSSAGTVYVLFGQASDWPVSFNLTTLNGSNGFRVEGLKGEDKLGWSVSTAGDMNDDGRSELVLGSWAADPGERSEAGTAYVLFGRTNGWPASFNLTTLDGNNGFRVEGAKAQDRLGTSVSTAGDVNGDGRDDLMLGAPIASPGGRNQAGMVYVLFGQVSGWPASFNLTTLNGSNGFWVEGVKAGDRLGWSVSTAGDMNGDGRSDLVLGAYYASPDGRSNAGTVYVLFGQADGWPASFNLTTLNGSNGFRVEGVNPGDRLGWSVSAAGDMNWDNRSDLVLGAPYASPGGRSEAGTVYVLFGKDSGWPAFFNLSTLNGGNGFWVEGLNAHAWLGRSVSTAGDINGDDRLDLGLGAWWAPVLFSRAGSWPASFNLTTLDGNNGFRVEGGPSVNSIWYASSAGDIKGEGRPNLVLGAPGASPDGRSSAGTAYVLFGNHPPQLIHPLSDKKVNFEEFFNFIIDTNAFSDPDNDTLTYSATASGSSILPSWLTFDDVANSFSGTPNQAGIISITITVKDIYNLIASADFNLTVNRSPQLIQLLPDKKVNFEEPFTFIMDANTFSDPDNDTLTYSATQSGSSMLPSWMTFKAATRSFSGIPNQTGILPITVTAKDPYNLTASADFNININRPPHLVHPLPDKKINLEKPFNFVIDTNAFSDPDNDILTYSAMQSGSSILPSWMTFNAATRSFSGIRNQTGTTPITITAKDPYNLTASADFNLNVNRPPQLIHPLPDRTVAFEKSFNFIIASNTFSDPDVDELTYSTAQSGNSTLPSWMTFNAATRIFSGIPNQMGTIPITVTAKDPYNLTASADFNINVQNQGPDLAAIIGGVVGGVAALGGLASAAYLAYKRGFFGSDRNKKVAGVSPDTEIELTKKKEINLVG